jgi:hypothetical protein
MSVRILDGAVRIDGNGLVEDAETILAALLGDPTLAVDLGGCGRVHTAIVQVLLALRPQIVGTPTDHFYAVHIAPLFDVEHGSA